MLSVLPLICSLLATLLALALLFLSVRRTLSIFIAQLARLYYRLLFLRSPLHFVTLLENCIEAVHLTGHLLPLIHSTSPPALISPSLSTTSTS